MKPTNIRFLTQPVTPFRINQKFGEFGACVGPGNQVITPSVPRTCPPGYRSLYGKGGHNGLDLQAAKWQRVYAAAAGTVIEKETEPDRGLGIGIVTAQRYWCEETRQLEYFKVRYWHLAGFDVDLGETVETGAFIGYADNTGFSSGDHLHFEVKPVRQSRTAAKPGEWENVLANDTNGAVDPLPYMNTIFALTAADFMRRIREQFAILLDMFADLSRYGKI
jgi:murein DD-endopeptidase MepM/ murein hydrolase activator NlpD